MQQRVAQTHKYTQRTVVIVTNKLNRLGDVLFGFSMTLGINLSISSAKDSWQSTSYSLQCEVAWYSVHSM